jgi:hypothetical protein
LKFDGNADDSSGNGFDANVVNAPGPNCWVAGRINGAIQLNAAQNEYLDLAGDGNNVKYLPGGKSARTMTGWFEAGDNQYPTFFDYGDFDVNAPGGRFAVTASSRRLAVTVGAHVTGVDNLSPPLKGWHHIAVVFPGGAVRSNEVRIFLDGVQQITHTLDNSGGAVVVNINTWDPNAYAYIGRDCGGHYFNGKIDDVRVYSRALRSSEITVVNAAQTRYHVIDLGPIDPKTSPQSSEAWDINNKGSVVGSTTVFLDPNTTYYWLIDEKNGCGTTQGQPWSFTTGSE